MTILDNIESSYSVFNAINTLYKRQDLERFSDGLYQKYCSLFSDKKYITNVAWIGRHYLASKKIAMSALFYTQAKYLMTRRMKNLASYACYYALFNGLSANLLMSPYIDLGTARSISHSALAKQVENFFVRRGIYQKQILDLLGDLRFSRELYSYHLPLQGPSSDNDHQLSIGRLFELLTEMLPAVLQTSSLLSYLSYSAWEKKVGKPIDEYEKHRDSVDGFFHSIVGYDDSTGTRRHYDDGDYMQLGYYLLKLGQPMPIAQFITDKILDEIEGGWAEEEEREGGYEIESVAAYLAETIESPPVS